MNYRASSKPVLNRGAKALIWPTFSSRDHDHRALSGDGPRRLGYGTEISE
jgi:hypothetical protein